MKTVATVDLTGRERVVPYNGRLSVFKHSLILRNDFNTLAGQVIGRGLLGKYFIVSLLALLQCIKVCVACRSNSADVE